MTTPRATPRRRGRCADPECDAPPGDPGPRRDHCPECGTCWEHCREESHQEPASDNPWDR